MFIAKNIRFLRRKANMTQTALSEQIGKTSITISDYEKGKSTPPIDVALQLCSIFGVDLNQLVTQNLEKEEIIKTDAPATGEDPAYADYLQEQYETLKRLTTLQDQRVQELEREIREHAPALAKRLGL